jgi:hypothetical protein
MKLIAKMPWQYPICLFGSFFYYPSSSSSLWGGCFFFFFKKKNTLKQNNKEISSMLGERNFDLLEIGEEDPYHLQWKLKVTLQKNQEFLTV